MKVRDNGESIGLFEPLIVSQGARSRPGLDSLAASLADKTLHLSSTTTSPLAGAFAHILAIANSHFSNLIEGHYTRPVDIERAMRGDYSCDDKERAFQIEAVAHIAVQDWIDAGASGYLPFSMDSICEVHKRLYSLVPSSFLDVADGTDQTIRMQPGAIRLRDVQVGRHIAVSPGAVPRYLKRMEQAYNSTRRIEQIVIAACGHHRLLWVHPFLDGNGRVARLVSHSALTSATGTKILWSISRGLARREKEYKMHLQACDEPRRGSLDGRGSLSEGALAAFTQFFLETSIEEVEFICDLLEPEKLKGRLLTWVHEQIHEGSLPPETGVALPAILELGQMEPPEIAVLPGLNESLAQRLAAALTDHGILQSEGAGSRLKLVLPVGLADRLLVGIF